jgi:ParB-like chromosome segregation protein Spo0J
MYDESGRLLVPISSIKIVGERGRENLGSLKALAKSIEKHGLWHAIVIDSDNNLVSGMRRLEAFKLLGREAIPATYFGELSELELREIELEENTRRKNLTREEKARLMTAYAEIAAEVIKEERAESNGSFLPGQSKKLPSQSKRGRQEGRPKGSRSEESSQEEIAKRMGVSQQELSRAQLFTQALDKYPELKSVGGDKDDVIRIARSLDQADEEDRRKYLNLIKLNDSDTIADLSEKPRMPRRSPEEVAREQAAERWHDHFYELSKLINSIRQAGGLETLAMTWSQTMKESILETITENREIFEEWEMILKRLIDE